jgi:hypothetical protein
MAVFCSSLIIIMTIIFNEVLILLLRSPTVSHLQSIVTMINHCSMQTYVDVEVRCRLLHEGEWSTLHPCLNNLSGHWSGYATFAYLSKKFEESYAIKWTEDRIELLKPRQRNLNVDGFNVETHKTPFEFINLFMVFPKSETHFQTL